MKPNALLALAALCVSAAVCGGTPKVPVVSDVVMKQGDGSRRVTIAYKLTGAPAVVTLDVQTNTADGAWVSIGADRFASAKGEWAKLVAADGEYAISWRPDKSGMSGMKIAEGGARAVVKAWAVNAPPDYMVIDLAATTDDRVRYYETEGLLPGGLLADESYRKTKLVMRRIHAKDVIWSMGAVAHGITPHSARLNADYYIGVFPVTQAQWKSVCGYWPPQAYFTTDRDMRPLDMQSFSSIRDNTWNTNSLRTDSHYPKPPYEWSWLGYARKLTLVELDLPTEAQWEFACRADTAEATWNTGAAVTTDVTAVPGRVKENGGGDGFSARNVPIPGASTKVGTATVGSHVPNAWGIHDMHGNCWEWCLDWYADDITALDGAVNVSADGEHLADGTTAGESRVCRGGSCWYTYTMAYSSYRFKAPPNSMYNDVFGFRVVCPCVAK